MGWPEKHHDGCINVFLRCQHRWRIPWRGSVLEIGCAEVDWLKMAQAADPSLDLSGCDVRDCARSVPVFVGDVRDLDRPAESLDGVVLISALEHIGLGRYGDPIWPDGDIDTLRLAWDWLRPGGHLYFDVPWTPGVGELRGDEYRVYDDDRIRRLERGGPWDVHGVGWFGQKGGDPWTQPAQELLPSRGWVYRATWWRKPEAR